MPRVSDRTRSDGPTGCRACLGLVATETHKLRLACNQNGGRLAHLPGEWSHPTKRMADCTPGSHEKMPWKCQACAEEWNAPIANRTRSDRPTGCPGVCST